MTACQNCEHGRSYHESLQTRRYPWDDYDSWITILTRCQYVGCTCKDYKIIQPEWRLMKEAKEHVMWSPEQIALNEQLKNAPRDSAIKIDKEFHELFCKVLKEQTERSCDCHGTTSEVRKSK